MSNLFYTFGRSVDGIDSPGQLALGVAIGCMIGFLPKDNLTFAGLLVFMILSGANLLTGALAGTIASFFTGALQPAADSIGQQLLAHEYMVVPLAKFLQLPAAPWTRLDNTVVFGSLAVGILAFLPIYVTSLFIFQKYRKSIQRLYTTSNIAAWVVGYSADEED